MEKEKLTKVQSQKQYDLITELEKSMQLIKRLFFLYDSKFIVKWKKQEVAETIDEYLHAVKDRLARAKKIPVKKENAAVLKEIQKKYLFFSKQAKKL